VTTVVISTRNKHKVQEITRILGEGFEFLSLAGFPDFPEVLEDGETFGLNAAKKAKALADWLGKGNRLPTSENGHAFVLADDSGLEVDALNGAPGVYSARFASLDYAGKLGNSSDADNNRKLVGLLRHLQPEKRKARFKCVLAWVSAGRPEAEPLLVEGACEGQIHLEPRGIHGFGYDPLFVPAGYSESFAELGEEIKNRISHRSQALLKLMNLLRK